MLKRFLRYADAFFGSYALWIVVRLLYKVFRGSIAVIVQIVLNVPELVSVERPSVHRIIERLRFSRRKHGCVWWCKIVKSSDFGYNGKEVGKSSSLSSISPCGEIGVHAINEEDASLRDVTASRYDDLEKAYDELTSLFVQNDWKEDWDVHTSLRIQSDHRGRNLLGWECRKAFITLREKEEHKYRFMRFQKLS